MALAAAAAAAPAWQALVGGGPLDRVVAAGAAEALARAGLLRQAGDALVAEGCDALRRGAVAALWRQLSPFEVDGYAAVLRGEAVEGRISRLASAGGSNGGEVGEAAAWVLSEVPTGVEALEAEAKALEARAAAVEGASAGAAGVRGLARRARNAVAPLLLTSAPDCLAELLERFFDCHLARFNAERRPDDVANEQSYDEEGDDGDGGSMEGVQHALGGDLESLGATCARLRALGLGGMAEAAAGAAVHRLARCRLRRAVARGFDEAVVPSVLTEMRQWSAAVPVPLMALALGEGGEDLQAHGAPVGRVAQWKMRLELYMIEQTGEEITSHFFDVVKAALAEDADVSGALADLREYLRTPRAHQLLVARFHASLRKRLLHAGVATAVILQVYVSAIKAMRAVDPSGVLLEAAGAPIREYLRSRRDTIRCVVIMLTDDSDSAGDRAGMESLLGELEAEGEDGNGAVEQDESDGDDGDGCSEEAARTAARWEPEPVEAEAWSSARGASSRRTTDIISMLVGIYGSKELFVSEYRVMLADRVLTRGGYDTEREIRTLELLKMRFGEANLHTCAVMLKDIADSKRINANVRADAGATTPYKGRAGGRTPGRGRGDAEAEAEAEALKQVDATVVSHLFWPPFQAGDGDSLKLPPTIEAGLEAYASRFHNLRAPRKLAWRRALGTVSLELRFEGSGLEREFSVSPMHAAIISAFGERTLWRAEELAEHVGLPVALLRRKAVYWVNQGVLIERRQSGDVSFEASSTGQLSAGGPATAGGRAEEEPESAVASAEQQAEAEMAVYESYVLGMLTNFDSLPLDRIHNMLKMFVSDPPYDKTSAQLGGFLSKLCVQGKLGLTDTGEYKKS